jgi:hypothetical protein
MRLFVVDEEMLMVMRSTMSYAAAGVMWEPSLMTISIIIIIITSKVINSDRDTGWLNMIVKLPD